jgi:hypothetical protein
MLDAYMRAQVCSTIIRTPAQQKSCKSATPADAFQGNLYLKCLSLAAAMEWILCDSLRPSSHEST